MFISPAVAGDRVFVGSCAGTFFALDSGEGEARWSYDTGRDGAPAQLHGDALVTEELVVVGSDARPQGQLYAFERASGEVRWKLPFPNGVTARVLGYRDSALAVTASGEAVAVDLATGRTRWRAEAPEGAAGGRVRDPALDGGRWYVGWGSGVVDAYDAAEILWERKLAGVPRGLGDSERCLYVDTLAGKVYALPWAPAPRSSRTVSRIGRTGRTSMLPTWAGGIFAATSIASSMSRASIR